MPRQLWIADKLRDYGCDVREVPGWKTRGKTTSWGRQFKPQAVMGHHTASNKKYVAPALKICVDGRKEAPGVTGITGPLCAVLIDRRATCHIVASGIANHAGRGSWRGLTGNHTVLGIEVENNGIGEPWSDDVYTAFVLCSAALLDGIGRDETWWLGHKEWTHRKIDPAGIDLNKFRRNIGKALNTGPAGPINQTPVDEMTKNEIMLMQALCTAVGVDPGPIDGIMGRRTKAAMAEAEDRRRNGTLDVNSQLVTCEQYTHTLSAELDAARKAPKFDQSVVSQVTALRDSADFLLEQVTAR